MRKGRWLVIFLCFLAVTINYIDRANLAVAAPYIQKEMGLSAGEMGLLMSGFFWTYALMQMPFGWFVDKVGARIALPLAVGWWSLFTAITAAASSMASLFGCRLLLGVGEAGCYPSCAKVVSQWFEVRERAFATSIFDSGSRVGSALSIPVVALLIEMWGWRASFIVTGLVGVFWIIGWMMIYREPEAVALMNQPPETSKVPAVPKEKISWGSLFRHRTLWGMMLGFFCLNFVIFFFITWFPTYLIQERGFSLKALGTLGTLPALASILGGWLGGLTSDALYRRGWSLTAARKTCIVGGMLMSSCIALSVFTESTYLMLGFFSLAYASLAFAGASIWSLPADVAPSPAHVASIGGIQNFASNSAGIFITTFTGYMLVIGNGSFTVPLVTAGCFAILGACSYLFIVGKVEPLTIKSNASTVQDATLQPGKV
jgi:MFS transporter, ACS family, D-galactonate transporter